MPRPRTITDQHILGAAREVFSEHGFSATTAQIARRAGISEGTLFKRFASKEELFAEVIGLNDLPCWQTELGALAGRGSARDNLETALLAFVEAARVVVPRLLLLWSRGHAPPPAHLTRPDHLLRDTRAFADYLDAEVGQGRLRPVDTEVVARALMGALTHYVMLEVHAQGASSELSPHRYVHELLEVLWPGLAPEL